MINIFDSLINKNQIAKDFGGGLPQSGLAFHDFRVNSAGSVELILGSVDVPDISPKSWGKCDAIQLVFKFNTESVDLCAGPHLGVNAKVELKFEEGSLLLTQMDTKKLVVNASRVSGIHLVVRPFVN